MLHNFAAEFIFFFLAVQRLLRFGTFGMQAIGNGVGLRLLAALLTVHNYIGIRVILKPSSALDVGEVSEGFGLELRKLLPEQLDLLCLLLGFIKELAVSADLLELLLGLGVAGSCLAIHLLDLLTLLHSALQVPLLYLQLTVLFSDELDVRVDLVDLALKHRYSFIGLLLQILDLFGEILG